MKRLISDICFVLIVLGLLVLGGEMVANELGTRSEANRLASLHAASSTPEPSASDAALAAGPFAASRPVVQDIVIRTVPAAQVWIDGQLRHMSPVFATLPQGHHRIAVGRGRPEVTRELDLHTQQAEPLTITVELKH
jgi:hypothetical protein